MTLALVFVPWVLAAADAAGVLAFPDERRKGTWSSLCIHEESGDLLGTELSFIATQPRITVLYLSAEGELGAPRLVAQAARDGHRLVFRSDDRQLVFTIEFDDDLLTLRHLQSDDETQEYAVEKLGRREPVWSGKQKTPDC